MKLNLSTTEAPSTTDRWASFNPSPHQQHIRNWVLNQGGSANVIAVAGSGKTTTLIWLCRDLQGNVALAAYNKKIADDIASKLALDGISRQRVQARTFHSFGLSAWKRVAPKIEVASDKMQDIVEQMQIPLDMQSIVKKLVMLAKNHAFGVGDGDLETEPWDYLIEHYEVISDDVDVKDEDKFKAELIKMGMAALANSFKLDTEVIDFDDMIYAPLVHNVPIWQNDWVLVDEAQDTNPARRLLAQRMLKPGGRAIFVGDPKQAIYGFTGADADALDIIEREFKSVQLPLTITYRCPKAVVRFAQKWVNHIQAANNAPEGKLETIDLATFRSKRHKELDHRTAVLCRLTKPLVQIAFELIKKKIPCHVEGRDIGKNLITLTRRFKENDARDMMERLDEWADHQVISLRSRRKEREAGELLDKVETLKVVVSNLEAGATVWDLRKSITDLFEDTPEGMPSRNVTLSTVHKAKGREWPTVYLYGRTSYMPSSYARQPWQLEQENNLIYVAVTRAMEKLVEVDLTLPAAEIVL